MVKELSGLKVEIVRAVKRAPKKGLTAWETFDRLDANGFDTTYDSVKKTMYDLTENNYLRKTTKRTDAVTGALAYPYITR